MSHGGFHTKSDESEAAAGRCYPTHALSVKADGSCAVGTGRLGWLRNSLRRPLPTPHLVSCTWWLVCRSSHDALAGGTSAEVRQREEVRSGREPPKPVAAARRGGCRPLHSCQSEAKYVAMTRRTRGAASEPPVASGTCTSTVAAAIRGSLAGAMAGNQASGVGVPVSAVPDLPATWMPKPANAP